MGKRDKSQGFVFRFDGKDFSFNKDIDLLKPDSSVIDDSKFELAEDLKNLLANSFEMLSEYEDPEKVLDVLFEELKYLLDKSKK